MHSFTVETASGSKKSPTMGSADIVQLRELFPKNRIWKSKTGLASNMRYPTLGEAKALYNAVVRYYAENDVSDETYQAGNFTGSVKVTSDLRSVFDDLLVWFEDDLGFKCSKKFREVIAKKQEEKHEKDDADYRQASVDFFTKLGVFQPIADPNISIKLEDKLQQYLKRMEEWCFQPPVLQATQKGYRDTSFKIFLVNTMLEAKEDVSIVDLAKKQMEELGDHFYADEFFNACAVMSVYLGTPFEGVEIAV